MPSGLLADNNPWDFGVSIAARNEEESAASTPTKMTNQLFVQPLPPTSDGPSSLEAATFVSVVSISNVQIVAFFLSVKNHTALWLFVFYR